MHPLYLCRCGDEYSTPSFRAGGAGSTSTTFSEVNAFGYGFLTRGCASHRCWSSPESHHTPQPCRQTACKTTKCACGQAGNDTKDESKDQADFQTCDEMLAHVLLDRKAETQAEHQVSDQIGTSNAH